MTVTEIILEKNELAKTGAQFGSLLRFSHAAAHEYIYAVRKGKCILDLEKINSSWKIFQSYLFKAIEEKKKILLICSKKKLQLLIKQEAEKNNFFYFNEKWIPGFLTNFEEVRKNLKKLQNFQTFIQKNSFQSLPKKQQTKLNKSFEKLQKNYKGVVNLWQVPDVLFVIGLKKEHIAFKEAVKKNIPVIAISNINANPSNTEAFLPINDENVRSLELIFNLINQVVISAQKNIIN